MACRKINMAVSMTLRSQSTENEAARWKVMVNGRVLEKVSLEVEQI